MNNISVNNKPLMSHEVIKDTQTNTGATTRFSDALISAVNNVNDLHRTADKAIINVQIGNSGSLHEAIIALEKADISFRTMLTVRNKIIEAYQEIMRMQV
jgi:flagellar hook-basal body complex protein FliE